MQSIKDKTKKAFDALKTEFGYENPMQAPKIEKVVVSCGVGSMKDKKKVELVFDRLSKITGQKPIRKGAKISIAAFKVREGDTVGMQVTLRGQRMYDFLDRFINVVLPRSRDFRGLDNSVIDTNGNFSFGIREHIFFPEISPEKAKDIIGLQITIATTAKNKEEGVELFKVLGFPLKNEA